MTILNAQGPTGPVDFDGYNTTGSTIPVFTAVRIDGAATHPDLGYPLPKLALALASVDTSMPCAGITTGDIDSNNVGTVRTFGVITDIDTSAFSVSDNLYVSGSVAGGIVNSNNPPNDIQQRVAVVLVSHATAGSIFVLIDTMLDGHVSYTNRDQFTVASPTTATARLAFSATGGTAELVSTPTGSRSLTLPDASDTLVGKATTDTLTGKTFDTAGAGNSLLINGLAATANTGTGAVVRAASPTFSGTPTLADFTNAQHDHRDADDGGTLDHGLALTGLTDDDHTQYALLVGRAGGQTIKGGTDISENLELYSTSHATKGQIILRDSIWLADQATTPGASELQRNGSLLQFGDGAVQTVSFIGKAETLLSKTLTAPTIGDFTNATHTHGNAAGGGVLAVGTALTNGTIGYALEAGDTTVQFAAIGVRYRREVQLLPVANATTLTNIGLVAAPTDSGTVSNVDSATRPQRRHVTGAVSGNSGGIVDITNTPFRIGWNMEGNFLFLSGNTITSYRCWIGFTTADLNAVATPTTQHVAAFSYDTGRDGTVFWRTVTCSGAATSVTATTVAFAASTVYNLRIVSSSSAVKFYIDNVLVNTHSSNLPGSGTYLGYQMCVTTLTNATRRFDWSRLAISHD